MTGIYSKVCKVLEILENGGSGVTVKLSFSHGGNENEIEVTEDAYEEAVKEAEGTDLDAELVPSIMPTRATKLTSFGDVRHCVM